MKICWNTAGDEWHVLVIRIICSLIGLFESTDETDEVSLPVSMTCPTPTDQRGQQSAGEMNDDEENVITDVIYLTRFCSKLSQHIHLNCLGFLDSLPSTTPQVKSSNKSSVSTFYSVLLDYQSAYGHEKEDEQEVMMTLLFRLTSKALIKRLRPKQK